MNLGHGLKGVAVDVALCDLVAEHSKHANVGAHVEDSVSLVDLQVPSQIPVCWGGSRRLGSDAPGGVVELRLFTRYP